MPSTPSRSIFINAIILASGTIVGWGWHHLYLKKGSSSLSPEIPIPAPVTAGPSLKASNLSLVSELREKIAKVGPMTPEQASFNWLGLLESYTQEQLLALLREVKAQPENSIFHEKPTWPLLCGLLIRGAKTEPEIKEIALISAYPDAIKKWGELNYEAASASFKPTFENGLIGLMLARDQEKAWAIMKRLGAETNVFSFYATQTFSEWADKSPKEASEFVLQHFDGNSLGSLGMATLNRWLLADAKEALSWFKAQKSPKCEGALRNQFISALARTAPALAANYMQEVLYVSTSNDYEYLFNKLSQSWSARDKAAHLKWVSSLPPGRFRTQALAAAVHELADKDPQAVSRLIEQETQPTAKFCSQISEITAHPLANAEQSYQRYIALTQLDDGKIYNAAMSENLVPISSWLVETMKAIAHGDPAAAERTFHTLVEAKSGDTGRFLTQWRKKDPAAARQALEASSLPESEKAKLLAPFTTQPTAVDTAK